MDSSTTGIDMIVDHPSTNNHSMPSPSLAAYRAFKIQKASKTNNQTSKKLERPHIAPAWRDRQLRCTEAIAAKIAANSTASPSSPTRAPSSLLRSSTPTPPTTTTKASTNRVPCYQGQPIPPHLVPIIQPDGSTPTSTLDHIDDDARSNSPTGVKRSHSPSISKSSDSCKRRRDDSTTVNEEGNLDKDAPSRPSEYTDRWCSNSALTPSSSKSYRSCPRPMRTVFIDEEDVDDDTRCSCLASHPKRSRSTSSSSSSKSSKPRHRRERATIHEDELDDDAPSIYSSSCTTTNLKRRFPTQKIYTFIWGGLHSQLHKRLITLPIRDTPGQLPTWPSIYTRNAHQRPIHNDAIKVLVDYRDALAKWDAGMQISLGMEGYRDDVRRRRWFLGREEKGLGPEGRVREERRWRGRGFKGFR